MAEAKKKEAPKKDAKTDETPETEAKATEAKASAKPTEEVESNHNGDGAAKPVQSAQMRNVKDYNPAAKKPSVAHLQSRGIGQGTAKRALGTDEAADAGDDSGE